jgi:hypothetical protein
MTRVLGSHRDVHAIDWESRFIVDPGGFRDLARALTTDYDPFTADDALRRLAALLNGRVAGTVPDVFHGWGLVDEIGPRRYWAAVDALFAELTWYAYDEPVPPGRHRYGQDVRLPGEPATNRRVVGRYFPDRTRLLKVLRDFTSAVFDPLADAAGKRTWVEKTPFNVLSVPFLWQLYPDASFVHMIRDPLAVVASHLDQSWAPDTLRDAVRWVEPVYRRWLRERAALLADPRYLEVRLEDAAADWTTVRAELLGRLGLADDPGMLGFEPARVSHRDGQLSPEQERKVLDRLGDIRAALGY